MTFSSEICASWWSTVSERPSEKYSSSGLPEKFSKGSTAIEASDGSVTTRPPSSSTVCESVSAGDCDGADSLTSTAALLASSGISLSTTTAAIAKASMTTMTTLILPPVSVVMDWLRSTSFSSLRPSGVIS